MLDSSAVFFAIDCTSVSHASGTQLRFAIVMVLSLDGEIMEGGIRLCNHIETWLYAAAIHARAARFGQNHTGRWPAGTG